MKIIKSFSLIICLFVGVVTYAQSHNTTAGSACKYAKNRCTNMEGCPQCAACTSEDKKEKDAKIAEVKRRNDKIWADAKAKKDAEQKAYQAKLDADNAEAKRKEESGNVVINAQPTSTTVRNQTQKPKYENAVYQNNCFYNVTKTNQSGYRTLDYIYFTENSTGFKINEKSILNNNEFAGYFGIDSISNGKNFPPNIGIVRLHKKRTVPPGNGRKVSIEAPIYDLVNSKGDRLFNDDKITVIMHFVDDYFIIGRGEYSYIWYDVGYGTFTERVEIYNLTTKQSYILDKQTTTYGITQVDKRVSMFSLDDMWPEGSYKAYIKSEVGHKHFKAYYITNDGKIESQDLNYNK